MIRWRQASGTELEDRLAYGQSLSDLVPAEPAIYMWRRQLTPPAGIVASPSKFRDWVEQTLRIPLAALGSRELSHYLVLSGLRFGGQGFNSEKTATLEQMSKSGQGRKYVVGYIQSLSPLLPAIYVGEAGRLDERIRQHLTGESGLREVLNEEMQLTFAALELQFTIIPSGETEQAKAIRTLLETIATKLTVAPCVRRIG